MENVLAVFDFCCSDVHFIKFNDEQMKELEDEYNFDIESYLTEQEMLEDLELNVHDCLFMFMNDCSEVIVDEKKEREIWKSRKIQIF